MDKIIALLTLGFAKGYRTFMVGGTIICLAAAHKWLGLEVPQDIWIMLFGVLAICLRAGMPAAALGALLCCALLAAGCRTVNINLPAIPPSMTNEPPSCLCSEQIRIFIDQSAQPSVNPSILSGLDSNAVQAVSSAAVVAAKAGAL